MEKERSDAMNTKTSNNGILANTNPIMSIGSAIIIIAFVLFTIIDPEYANGVYEAAKGFIATELAWYYILLMSFSCYCQSTQLSADLDELN